MTNREIAQEISSRIGNSPVPFDSVYSIALQIYNELGGEETQFDSVYSILLEILPLVEGGGGNAIEEVDELPEASENKDKLFRLDNGEKDVYVAKLLSSETITTNRLPDEQQIDKAYLYEYGDINYYNGDINYYKGVYKIVCIDGEIEGYGWLMSYTDSDDWYFYLTQDNAVNVSNDTKSLPVSSGDGNINIENHTVTITNGTTIADYYNWDNADELLTNDIIPIPAIYNAPDSEQVDNAYVTVNNDNYTYNGNTEEVLMWNSTTLHYDTPTIVYVWKNPNYEPIFATEVTASNVYGQNQFAYCWYVEDGDNSHWEGSYDLRALQFVISSISTVKYQREETIEEWSWENITPTYATTADIEALFADPVPPTQPNDELWYTTNNNQAITIDPESVGDYFDKPILSNTYSDGKGIIKFDGDLTALYDNGFQYITEDYENITSIQLPESVTELGFGAFEYCSNLVSVKLPSNYTNGIQEQTFNECSSLESIEIPEGTAYIADSAFLNCSSLTTITIPSNVTSLLNAFNGCSSLESIICEPTTPPYATGNMFEDTNNCPIYVPAESVNAYKTAEGWTDYASRIQAIQ